MPTYEYQCSHCGNRWEKFQSITAAPIKVCPACGKRTAQRLIGTGAGVIFKGSGFYITDYRSDSYKEKAKSESNSAKPAETPPASGAAGAKPDAAKPAAEAKPAGTEKSSPAKPAAAAKPTSTKRGK